MHDEQQPRERAPELRALLRDLDGLRLSLAADLSLAAAALEAGSPDLAAAVVDGDREQLAGFEERALERLRGAGAHETQPAESPLEGPAAVPAEAPAARRRRPSLVTAATPLLATAAALVAVFGGVVPTGGEAPERATPQTAMASYQQVTQLTLEGAEAAEVAAAAERLHAELATIVAQASSDPAAAQQALALLESEARVLSRSLDRDKLTDVIAQARTLVARLRAALPVPPRTSRLPSPTAAPNDVVVPAQVAVAPAVPAPASGGPEPSPSPSERPSEQASSPSPEPEPNEEDQQSGEPSSDSGGVLPAAVLPPE